mgnify:CR=1 FL=1
MITISDFLIPKNPAYALAYGGYVMLLGKVGMKKEAVVMLLRRLRPGANVVELDRIAGMESAVAQHGVPELICLDLKLPDTTGTSGVQQMKGRYPE